MVTAEQLVKFAARQAEKMFKRSGRVPWMYHYVKGNGDHAVFAPPPFLRTKDQVVAVVQAIFETEQAIAYVFLNEGWTFYQDGIDRQQVDALLEKYGSLEHVPGRQEVIMLMAEDADSMISANIPIHRPEGREPYLGKLDIMRPEGMEGRMVGLLPQRATKQ